MTIIDEHGLFGATNAGRHTHTHTTHTHTHTHTHIYSRKAITSDLSHQYNNEGDGFLSQIAMGDETCISTILNPHSNRN